MILYPPVFIQMSGFLPNGCVVYRQMTTISFPFRMIRIPWKMNKKQTNKQKTEQPVYMALVRALFEYSNTVWDPHQKEFIYK